LPHLLQLIREETNKIVKAEATVTSDVSQGLHINIQKKNTDTQTLTTQTGYVLSKLIGLLLDLIDIPMVKTKFKKESHTATVLDCFLSLR